MWHRVVQIVTNDPPLQRYAAETVLAKLRAGSAHETMVKVAGYLLGEFGHKLTTPRAEYFGLLQQRFPACRRGAVCVALAACTPNAPHLTPRCSLPTKALLLSSYAKLLTHANEPAFAAQVAEVFGRYAAFADVELQQRSSEYSALASLHPAAMKEVLAEMPNFPERASALERRLKEAGDGPGAEGAPKSVWVATAADAPPPPASAAPPPSRQEVAPQRTRMDNLLGLLDDGLAVAAAPPAYAAAQPPAAPQQPRGGGDFLSELAQPASAAPRAPDSLGGLDSFASAPQQAVAPATLPPLHPPAALFRKLCTADAGVLYEDAMLQIGWKSEWRQVRGLLAIRVGWLGVHSRLSQSAHPISVTSPRAAARCWLATSTRWRWAACGWSYGRCPPVCVWSWAPCHRAWHPASRRSWCSWPPRRGRSRARPPR